jgi:hypothetical protein
MAMSETYNTNKLNSKSKSKKLNTSKRKINNIQNKKSTDMNSKDDTPSRPEKKLDKEKMLKLTSTPKTKPKQLKKFSQINIDNSNNIDIYNSTKDLNSKTLVNAASTTRIKKRNSKAKLHIDKKSSISGEKKEEKNLEENNNKYFEENNHFRNYNKTNENNEKDYEYNIPFNNTTRYKSKIYQDERKNEKFNYTNNYNILLDDDNNKPYKYNMKKSNSKSFEIINEKNRKLKKGELNYLENYLNSMLKERSKLEKMFNEIPEHPRTLKDIKLRNTIKDKIEHNEKEILITQQQLQNIRESQ